MLWARYPFLRFTLALVFGILANNVFRSTETAYYLLLFFVVGISVFIYWKSNWSSYKNPRITIGVFALSMIILLGFLVSQFNYQSSLPTMNMKDFKLSSRFLVKINSRPVKTTKTIKFEVLVEKLLVSNKWHDCEENAILYFSGTKKDELKFGDRLLINGNLKPIQRQTNPYAFNYAEYMQRQRIYLQSYVTSADFLHVNSDHGYSLKYLSLLAGDYFERTISKYISSDRELDMVKAMVIGRRDEITPEMEFVYNATGTSHILAVSGLHVGIIFLIFSRLFRFMNYGKLRWFYLTLILVMIWSYALITGLSPSVMRASTMISIVLLADASWRKSNIYNSILASAFLLLLLDSNLIYSVSFQLSYAAVFGIVFLYKRIYRLLFIKDSLLNFFWKITVLSISAQLATFPLTIYYFHQFPLFSLITNLLAIPTAGLVVIGSLSLIVTSLIEPVPILIGKMMEICISIYNEVMLFISGLEYALIKDVHLKPYAVLLIFFSLLLIARFIVNYKLSHLRYLIIILFVLVASKFLDYGIRSSQSKIIFYDVPGKSYYDVYLGRKCYTNVKEGSHEVFYNVIPSRDFNLISEVSEIVECPFSKFIGDNLLIYFNGTSILLLADIDDLSKQSEDVIFNYVFINKRSLKFAPIILQKFKIDHIIFDASIRNATIEKISKDIDLKITMYSIADQGALEIHI